MWSYIWLTAGLNVGPFPSSGFSAEGTVLVCLYGQYLTTRVILRITAFHKAIVSLPLSNIVPMWYVIHTQVLNRCWSHSKQQPAINNAVWDTFLLSDRCWILSDMYIYIYICSACIISSLFGVCQVWVEISAHPLWCHTPALLWVQGSPEKTNTVRRVSLWLK